MIHLRYLFEGRSQLSWPEAGMSPLITKVSQVALVHMLGVPAFVWHNAKLESVLLGGWKLGDWKVWGFWHVKTPNSVIWKRFAKGTIPGKGFRQIQEPFDDFSHRC